MDPTQFKSIGKNITFDDDVQFQRGVIVNPAGDYIDIGIERTGDHR